MINYKEFERKVKSMSAHDIIMAMVNGLRTPKTEIDMGTFGGMIDGICYGCAATNAILHIMDVNTAEKVEEHVLGRESHWDDFLGPFEDAIDFLRLGNVSLYNSYAINYGFASITHMPGQELPRLDNDYTEEQLKEYVKLAKYQLTTKNQTNDQLQRI